MTIREYSLLSGEGGGIEIGDRCYIDRNVLISSHGGKIRIGNDCSFNPNCVIYGHGGLTIGNGVRIAAGTTIVPANHSFSDPSCSIKDQPITAKGITIEDDVWVGAGVVITDGLHIGKGAVIGAGSVVTHDVAERVVVAGVPAREISRRPVPTP